MDRAISFGVKGTKKALNIFATCLGEFLREQEKEGVRATDVEFHKI